MHDPTAAGARAATERLTPVYGARLRADVEAALRTRDTDQPPPSSTSTRSQSPA
jgi:hypothetical protein